MPLRDRNDPYLLWRQPQGERSRVVLDEHTGEPFHGPQDGPVDHDRAMSLVVLAHVLDVESLGQCKVALHRGELPQAPDGVVEVEVHLGPVERALTLGDAVFHAARLQGLAEGVGGPPPHLLVSDGLSARRLGGQLDDRIGESERAMDLEREVEHGQDLLDQLVGPAEDVGVVDGQPTDAQQPVQRPGALVPVHGPELGQPHGQITVRPGLGFVDQDVQRAVHGLGVVRPAFLLAHGRVHVLAVLLEVSRGRPHVGAREVRGGHDLVPALKMGFPDEVL